MHRTKSTELGRTPTTIRRAVAELLRQGHNVFLEDIDIGMTPAMLPALRFMDLIEAESLAKRSAAGKKGGRRSKFSDADKEEMARLWHDVSVPQETIMQRFSVSPSTLGRLFGPRYIETND